MSAQDKRRILFLSDYGPNCMTGYATVSRNLISNLMETLGDHILIDVVAINYFDEPYKEYDNRVSVVSAKKGQRKFGTTSSTLSEGDDFGRLTVIDFLASKPYDLFFVLNDLGTVVHLVPLLKQCDIMGKEKFGWNPPKKIIYFPVDGKLHYRVINEEVNARNPFAHLPKEQKVKGFFPRVIKQIEELAYFDISVTYTDYGLSQIISQAQENHFHGLHDFYAIPHGTNVNDFYPIDDASEKIAFRKKYFGQNSNKFIVGLINRNQYRKDIPTSIFGFIEAKKNWPENLPKPFLYMHMNPSDHLGWKLRDVLSQTSLKEGFDYMFSEGDNNNQVPVNTLNKIYNSIDCYLSTALGGGWELTVTEAMACKTPCIIPEHTSMAEIGQYGNNAYMLEEFLPISIHADNVIRQMCHYEEVAEKIIEVAKAINNLDENHHNKIESAFKFVRSLEWSKLFLDYWFDVFKKSLRL